MSEPVPSPAQDDSERALSRWPRWSSALHQSLASHEASASELRQELDDLRRTLDFAPPGVAARRTRPSRRTILVAAAVAVLVLALGIGIATRAARSGSAPEAAVAASASSHTALPAAAPLPRWPGQAGPEPPGLPGHGVGADLPGTEVTAAFRADRRSVEVYERALLAPAGTTLTLRPATSDEVVRSLRAPSPTVEDVHAAIDGRPVPATRTASGWIVPVSSTTTGAHLTLRYRLGGAVVRTEPAPRGRYTLVLTPLTPADGAAGAVVVRIRDPRVEEVYCPGTANQLCGHGDGPLHVATVSAGSLPIVVGLVTFTG
jgi:hypothetical protein